jgi:hypothetical protein
MARFHWFTAGLMLALLGNASAHAAGKVYQYQNENGVTVFSDSKVKSSKSTRPASYADRVYQYQMEDGEVVFTDKRISGQKPVKVSYYGRPTAKVSCAGIGNKTMNTRIQRYTPFIDKYAKQHDIQPGLVKAVITTESCFDHKAVSRVGAKGLMQLMPETAESLGVTDIFDPEQNIAAGIRYLRMMLDEFEQDRKLALAAYNAGPNAVKKYNGIPPYKETQNYVKRVLDHSKKFS